MKMKLSGVFVMATLFVLAPLARAAVPVEVKLESLRCIQTHALDMKAEDQVYAVVSGVAKGEPVSQRIPESGTLAAAPKKLPVSEPVSLWKGELDNGQFAQLTFTLMVQPEGEETGDAAATKSFLDAIDAAGNSVAARSKPTLTAEEMKALAEETLKAHREVIMNVKDTLDRLKKTESFAGQFTITVLNDGGKIIKRLDPVGLTFGEHYGTDVKIYSKLKFTRNNVLVQDEGGQFFPQQLEPLSQDRTKVRVKMLETEFVKKETGKTKDDGTPETRLVKNVTDYVAELSITAEDKPLDWSLGGENPSDKGPLHPYWDFAE